MLNGKNLCINYKLKVVRRGEARLWPPEEDQQVPDWADLPSVSRQAPAHHHYRPTILVVNAELNLEVWATTSTQSYCDSDTESEKKINRIIKTYNYVFWNFLMN